MLLGSIEEGIGAAPRSPLLLSGARPYDGSRALDKGSVLGVAWYFVNPLVLMGAYALVFSVLLKVVPCPQAAHAQAISPLIWDESRSWIGLKANSRMFTDRAIIFPFAVEKVPTLNLPAIL